MTRAESIVLRIFALALALGFINWLYQEGLWI
jgi:hypothetical protein